MANRFTKWVVASLLGMSMIAAPALMLIKHPAPEPYDHTHTQPLSNVADSHQFYGLAAYYNGSTPFLLKRNGDAQLLKPEEKVHLKANSWIGLKGRYKLDAIQAPGATASIKNNQIHLQWIQAKTIKRIRYVGPAKAKQIVGHWADFSRLRYSHLWTPLAYLSRGIEWLMVNVHLCSELDWGWTILLLCCLVKLTLLPLNLYTTRCQNAVNRIKAQLEPKLAEIKANFDGEEAHTKIMAAHKDLGVGPFYTLKPLLSNLIQAPILIAIFNALGEMPQLEHASFTWIPSLAYPDVLCHLPLTIPLLGNTLNGMPLWMTLVTLISTYLYQNTSCSAKELSSQKRKLYLMAFGFLILFYPFPSGMVLYWTFANLLQFIQQTIERRSQA